MKQGSAFPYISYAVVRPARIGFSLMTHCICHERGTRFNAVPGSTPNSWLHAELQMEQHVKEMHQILQSHGTRLQVVFLTYIYLRDQ
jgi:hypothetical protein